MNNIHIHRTVITLNKKKKEEKIQPKIEQNVNCCRAHGFSIENFFPSFPIIVWQIFYNIDWTLFECESTQVYVAFFASQFNTKRFQQKSQWSVFVWINLASLHFPFGIFFSRPAEWKKSNGIYHLNYLLSIKTFVFDTKSKTNEIFLSFDVVIVGWSEWHINHSLNHLECGWHIYNNKNMHNLETKWNNLDCSLFTTKRNLKWFRKKLEQPIQSSEFILFSRCIQNTDANEKKTGIWNSIDFNDYLIDRCRSTRLNEKEQRNVSRMFAF